MSVHRLGSKAHFIRMLEAEGLLDRQIESLPSRRRTRRAQGTRHQGLTRPELSILLSYAKIELYQQLLDSDVPEDPYLSKELARYFPVPLQDEIRRAHAAPPPASRDHRDRGDQLDGQPHGRDVHAAHAGRHRPAAGRDREGVHRVREVIDARSIWAEIEALDGKVADAVQVDALLKVWDLLRNLTRWLLNHRGVALDIASVVARYAPGVGELRDALPRVLTPTGRADYDVDVEKWQGLGIPEAIADRLATVPVLGAALDIVEVAHDSGRPVERVASIFFEIGQALEIDSLRRQIENLPVESRWHAQARGSLRDELAAQHRALVTQILASAPPGAPNRVAGLARARRCVAEIHARHARRDPHADDRLSDRFGRAAPARAARAGRRAGGLSGRMVGRSGDTCRVERGDHDRADTAAAAIAASARARVAARRVARASCAT